MIKYDLAEGANDLPLTLGCESWKGGGAMKEKISLALKKLSKVAAALSAVSKAGLEVMSIFED